MKMLLTLLLLAPLMALAQTNGVSLTNGVPVIEPPVAPLTPTADLLLLLTAVVVPLIVALGKWVVPRMPTWILPIAAPALGALVDYLLSLASGGHSNLLVGALLGSAGVGIRELKDQVQKRVQEGPPATPTVKP